MVDMVAAGSSALRVRPVLSAWALAVGVDLFFNAGLFVGLFDQGREPGLLADADLFRRVPVAYVGLLIGVTALGWLVDAIDLRGLRSGALTGALAGAVAASLGIVLVWTAIEMTGWFVAAGVLVQIAEFGAVGAFLGAFRDSARPRRVATIAIVVSCALAVAGIVLQNLLPA